MLVKVPSCTGATTRAIAILPSRPEAYSRGLTRLPTPLHRHTSRIETPAPSGLRVQGHGGKGVDDLPPDLERCFAECRRRVLSSQDRGQHPTPISQQALSLKLHDPSLRRFANALEVAPLDHLRVVVPLRPKDTTALLGNGSADS